MLTCTNYADWAMIMRVQLQAQGLWEAVEFGDDESDDRAALGALLRAVLLELVHTLTGKDGAKAAWDTLKNLRMGCKRVQEARAQTCHREFKEHRFCDGESIEDFALHLTAIVNDLQLLNDPVTEHQAVLKFLRAVPRNTGRWQWPSNPSLTSRC